MGDLIPMPLIDRRRRVHAMAVALARDDARDLDAALQVCCAVVPDCDVREIADAIEAAVAIVARDGAARRRKPGAR
jgi:hypothetical protein